VNQPLKQARLGRGLSALLGDYAGARNAIDSPTAASEAAAINDESFAPSEIAIDRIIPNPKQPRRTFVEAELEELAESIRTKGVLQAILVRPDPSSAEMF
jgi:ParB family chromosome partitioning protein